MSPRTTSAPDKSGKPAVKTTTGKTAAAKTRPAAATPRPKVNKTGLAPQTQKRAPISAEERMRLIAEAAYYKAEKRDFAQGSDLENWIEAEAEIDALLNSP